MNWCEKISLAFSIAFAYLLTVIVTCAAVCFPVILFIIGIVLLAEGLRDPITLAQITIGSILIFVSLLFCFTCKPKTQQVITTIPVTVVEPLTTIKCINE